MTKHKPELILNNFNTRSARLRILKAILHCVMGAVGWVPYVPLSSAELYVRVRTREFACAGSTGNMRVLRL